MTVKERPILFSAPMVRALLAGTKTQTRRIVKPQPDFAQVHDWRGKRLYDSEYRTWCWRDYVCNDSWAEVTPALRHLCPYGQPGDRLWVRETWRTSAGMNDKSPKQIAALCEAAGYSDIWAPLRYEADGATDNAGPIVDAPGGPRWGKTRVSIHMPRWASRISLEITDVRVQQMNDINDEDAFAEGVDRCGHDGYHTDQGRCAFRSLWLSINGAGSWDANPWVWAISFKRVPQ